MKQKKIAHIAPILSKLKNSASGFEVPKGYFKSNESTLHYLLFTNALPEGNSSEFNTPESYFDSIEDMVMARLKAESMSNNTDFENSDSYFENLEDRVISKLNNSRSSLKTRVLQRFAAPIAIAASLLLIFSIFNKSTFGFTDLETADLEEWISTESYLETEQLLVVFENTDLGDLTLSASVSNEEILDYLDAEQLDEFLYGN